MDLTSFSDRKITGTIDVEKAGNLVFSIAREDGWTVYVDGKETEPETFAEAFLSIPLEVGIHEIKLCYTTPGLKLGAMISVGCVILFALSFVTAKKIRSHRESNRLLELGTSEQ